MCRVDRRGLTLPSVPGLLDPVSSFRDIPVLSGRSGLSETGRIGGVCFLLFGEYRVGERVRQ